MSPVRLASRNPFETVILASAAISSAPGALGLVDAPPSVTLQLGPYARWWQVLIAVSALIALVGLALESPRRVGSTRGLLLEQVGCIGVGYSCLFYAIAAFSLSGWAALSAAGLILAYAVAGFWQAWKIDAYLRRLAGLPPRLSRWRREG